MTTTMTTTTNDGQEKRYATLFALVMLCVLILFFTTPTLVSGEPAGAQYSANTTDTGPTRTPSSLTTARGTITTMILNATQQDQHWKAYVGNVTGKLSLDDSDNNTIYDWTLSSITGEVYAANDTLTFTSVACANNTVIDAEHTALNMTGTQVDSVRKTFNSTSHSDTVVAGTTLSSCNSTALYVSDAAQVQSSTADFQEFLMQDASGVLTYVSIINDDATGFDDNTYDFQIIVGESDVQSARTYYFYVELDG